MLSFIDSFTVLRRDRHSSMEARTSSRLLRCATPQVETLENIVSLSAMTARIKSPDVDINVEVSPVIQLNVASVVQTAVLSKDVQQAAVITQVNANNGSIGVQGVGVTAT